MTDVALKWRVRVQGIRHWKLVYANSIEEAEVYSRKRWGARYLSVAGVYDKSNLRALEEAES